MTFFRNLPISRKFLVAFGIVCLLCIVQGLFSIGGISKINKDTASLAGSSLPSIRVLVSVQQQLNMYRRSDLGFYLCPTEACRTEYLQKRSKALTDYQTALKQYESLVSSDNERYLYQSFSENFSKYLVLSDQILSLYRSGKQNEAKDMIMSGEALAPCLEAINKLAEDVDLNFKEGVSIGNSAMNLGRTMSASSIIIVALATGLSGLVGWLLTRLLAFPLKEATCALERVAKKDLTVSVSVVSRDEVGRLSAALNTSIASMRSVLEAMSEGSNTLSAAATELSVRAEQASGNASSQSDKTSQIAAAAQEMTATIAEISNNSERASLVSRESALTATNGGKVMRSTADTMERIAASSSSAADKMRSLAQRSVEIGKVISVIQEISEQTNLLALNAAIESARAGEHGRGFAVVASEVRRLAERTKEATEEVSSTIRNVQVETQETLKFMDAGQAEVNSGIRETKRAEESLAAIIQSAAEVEHMIQLIATAATEQTAASGEISQSATEISKLAMENSQGSEETSEACKSLSSLANDLDSIIRQFQLQNDTRESSLSSEIKYRKSRASLPMLQQV